PSGPIAWASLTVSPGHPSQLRISSRTANPAITAALARIAGRPPRTWNHGNGWEQWATELPAPSRDELVVRQELPLEPLLDVLRVQGETNLYLVVQYPRVGFVILTGAPAVTINGALSATIPTFPARPLTLELGWRKDHFTRALLLLLLAFLAPMTAG